MFASAMKICIWTVVPNHYQNTFHTALRVAGIDLQVGYYEEVPPERLAMGWNACNELPEGEQFVPKALHALDMVPDWRERIHVVPGCGSAFLRVLASELSRARVDWVHWSEPSHPDCGGGVRCLGNDGTPDW